MTTLPTFKTTREAHLEMMLVDNTNVFSYALRLMKSLKEKTLTEKQYLWIAYEFEMHCKTEKIKTYCETMKIDLFN
ncbi:MAG: hypothetical protein EBS55_03825 [Flavobacteriaceae bacterium]|jgi:hypothetical protein|nr:hypothetical protein [Flavobacteriaceae bacterium]